MTITITPTTDVHPVSGRRVMLYGRDVDDATKPLVYTGEHAKGIVRLDDGTTYNVSDDWFEAASWEHFGELSHKLGLGYEADAHPLHKQRGYRANPADPGDTDYDPVTDEFHHICTWHCGDSARTADQAVSDWQARLTSLEAKGHVVADETEEQGGRTADERKADQVTFLERAHRRHAALAPQNDGRGGASMALASSAAENAALNGLAGVGNTNVIPDVSLHTATTSTTGASETANSGSYARQASSWNTASAGAMTNSTSLTFSTLGSVAVTYIGTWSSATYAGGTFAIGAALTAGVTSTSIAIASGAISFTAT